MHFTILTIFPELFDAFLQNGIIGRAVKKRIISCETLNIRDFTKDGRVDDKPYGGGSGMLFKPEPLFSALKFAKEKRPKVKTILLSPQGRAFDQSIAKRFASEKNDYIFICGRYEGIDERVFTFFDDEISVGDFVLTGGELPAMIIIDAITRLIPGSLGGEDSAENDSFAGGLIEHAHYTRPEVFENRKVPDVLLSGNHKKIKEWRLESSLKRTFLKRPDLFKNRVFAEDEIKILKKWHNELSEFISAEK